MSFSFVFFNNNRKTFRSGNPPPPNFLKDFYNQLFWYGFDPEETTTTSDSKTMFGGTKGKFNGLGLLSDIQEKNNNNNELTLVKGQNRRRKRFENDDYYYYNYNDDDDEYDDDYDDDEYNDDYDDDYSNSNSRNQRRRIPQKTKSSPRERRINYDYRDEYIEIDYDDDFDYENNDDYEPYDGYDNIGSRNNIQSTRSTVPNQLPPSLQSKQQSSTPTTTTDEPPFLNNEMRKDTGRRRKQRNIQNDYPNQNRRRRPRRRNSSIASSWFSDDDEESRAFSSKNQKSSPIINLLDAVFQVDSEEVQVQADDYNRKLGLDRGRISSSKSSTKRRRKGYAYPYTSEDNGDRPNVPYEYNSEREPGGEKSIDINVIDVEATIQTTSSQRKSKESELNGRQKKQQSWEERAQAYEKVPPSQVKAWGPEGEIDGGIDIRTYAARIAIEDIQRARNVFEKKEELVNKAENNLIQLKR